MGLPFLDTFSPSARHKVWRGDELGAADAQVIATGHAALDAQLPGGGWPVGAMTELLQFPSWRSRIGQAAREAVLQQFSLPVIAERTEAYYAAAIAEQPARNRRSPVVLEEDRPYARFS